MSMEIDPPVAVPIKRKQGGTIDDEDEEIALKRPKLVAKRMSSIPDLHMYNKLSI